ncbi:hypothetical protein Lal_00012989 [Lupinus albus]|nr:hypothetical protein Lal_00012989 [Lupinus albus]
MSQPELIPKNDVFIMRDQIGNNISCTLWGKFTSQLLKYEYDHKFGLVVVILTLTKIREAKSWTLENLMNHIINTRERHVHDLKGGSQDKLFHNVTVKTISKLIQLRREFICVTYGTIEKLFVNGWYYDGFPCHLRHG